MMLSDSKKNFNALLINWIPVMIYMMYGQAAKAYELNHLANVRWWPIENINLLPLLFNIRH